MNIKATVDFITNAVGKEDAFYLILAFIACGSVGMGLTAISMSKRKHYKEGESK